MNEVTRIINAIQHGDKHATEELLPLVYEELRLLAAQKMLKEKPELIKHEVVEDRVIFTASPKELQSFLTKHADDEEFFGDAGQFERYIPPKPDEDSDTDEKDEHQDDKDD